MWFTDVNFGSCRNDALGRQAARIMAREVVSKSPTIFLPWAEAVVRCALSGRKPRVDGLNVAVEIEQLCFAINRQGLILIIDAQAAQAPADAFVHAIEWIGQKAGAAVVVLFPELPDAAPPFDRILHGAVQVLAPLGSMPPAAEGEATTEWAWLAPVRGIPHPLSETEQRLAKALARDGELAPLFCFNQLIETIHGSRPKVDLRDDGKGPLFRSAIGKTSVLTATPMNRVDAYRMIRRRAAEAGFKVKLGCHVFRATGITAYLEAGGTLENAQAMAAHESPRTTKLYDRTSDAITLDEVERITI